MAKNAAVSTLTPINAAIALPHELSKVNIASLRADGAAAYEGEAALLAFAALFRPHMTTATQSGDFALFTESARQWRVGYEQTRRNTNDETVPLSDRSQDAFERRLKAAKSEDLGADRLLGDKPKSVNPDAERKAAARAAAAAVIEKMIAGKSQIELAREAKAADKAAAQAVKAAAKAQESKAKAAANPDPLIQAKAAEALEKARLEAVDKAAEAKTAALALETAQAKTRRAEAEAEAAAVKGFRERARALIAEAGRVQLIEVIRLLEAAGVKSAEDKKAEAAAKAEAEAAAKAEAGEAPM